MPGLVSAGNLISFLSDPDKDVRLYALKALDEQIDTLWLEIAPSITQVEALCEDESFSERELASLVAAKVYYHLQEYNESMVFALGAGKRLNLDNGGEFEKTIISKCVDTFIALSSMAKPAGAENEHLLNAGRQDGGAATSAGGLSSTVTPFTQSAVPSKSLLSRPDDESVDATLAGSGDEVQSEIKLVLERGAQQRLQTVIDGLFERSYEQKKYRQVIGIAVEAKNLDVLKKTLVRASQDAKGKGAENAGEDLMDYVLDICMSVVPERWFRNEILKLILELLNDLPSPDYFAIAKCVVYLNEHSMASAILRQLVEKGDPRSLSVAYQISFDLYDN
ncbi:proteasome regulatory particle base subunit, partial [Ascosphaera atra]